MKYLFGLIILILFSSCQQDSVVVDKYAYQRMLGLLTFDQEKIEVVAQGQIELYWKYNRPEKYKYAPIVSLFKDNADFLKLYQETRMAHLQSIKGLEVLTQQLVSRIEELRFGIISRIRKDAYSFGFFPDQVDDYSNELMEIGLNITGQENDYLNFIITEAMFFSALQELSDRCTWILGGINDEYWAFPVVSSNRCEFGLGEQIEFDISIGSYSTAYEPEDVVITVDGDTIEFSESGVATYRAIANSKGLHRKQLSFSVINRETGEVVAGDSEYIFRVY